MLGFHSQNVLQILENMKPIIFRINVTDEGEITFNKEEGMTNSQAYELMLRNGYIKGFRIREVFDLYLTGYGT